jgi:hypothetical protein
VNPNVLHRWRLGCGARMTTTGRSFSSTITSMPSWTSKPGAIPIAIYGSTIS